MAKNLELKGFGILFIILASFYLLAPTLFNFREIAEQAQSAGQPVPFYIRLFPPKTINLGLDLRGGLYVEMDVDLPEAVKNRVDVLIMQMERFAGKEEFPDLRLEQIYQERLVQVSLPAEKRESFLSFLKENFGDIFEVAPSTVLASPKPGTFFLQLTETYSNHLQEITLKQAVEAVRNRIDRFGVAEASIQLQGDGRIIVEIPGVKDPDRVINIIRKTGLLEFRLVNESVGEKELRDWVSEARTRENIPEGYSQEIVDKINMALKDKIPDGDEILFEVVRDPMTKEIVEGIPYLVSRRSDVTGDMLRNAQVGIANNEPYVTLSFNKMGTKNFGEVTKANVGKRLAIVLDHFVNKAPVIQSAILEGEAQITLGYGNYHSLLTEAEDLALMLREGALPASLTVATKTVIGPSLGADSIRKGIHSMIIAAGVIVIFMMIYYTGGGVLANGAMILNILMVFAILTLFQASLTLPGIAGIVLTMGMAVDANIIIFERMKEEIRLGKTPRAVVESGYSNAMSAIIDSNLTTLFAGIVLFQFGTGPIKGFATTLMVGILTTMFTAIVVTRVVYDYFVTVRKIGRLSL